MEEVQGCSSYRDKAATCPPAQPPTTSPQEYDVCCVHQENVTKGLMCHNKNFLQLVFLFLQVLEYLSRGLMIASSVRSNLKRDFNFGYWDG